MALSVTMFFLQQILDQIILVNHHKQILGWLSFIVGEFCHFFRLFRHCFLMSLHLRTLFLLVVTFRPSYHISARKSISLLLCAWHEMTMSGRMVMVVDEERSKEKRKMPPLWIQDLKVSGSYSINIKHTQSLKGKSPHTHITQYTHIKWHSFWDSALIM